MCEPTHSIVQYPNDDPNDFSGPGSQVDTETKLKAGFREKIGDWFKKIGDWFHLSRLGSGHSEAVTTVNPDYRHRLPNPTFYEANWWDRTVHLDSMGRGFHDHQYNRDEAMECAIEYSKRVVIGNLSMLRRFLETSMQRSDRPEMYVEAALVKLFTRAGKLNVEGKLRKMLGNTYISCCRALDRKIASNLKSVTAVILGATRKREYLVDAWAMDDSLWVPGVCSS